MNGKSAKKSAKKINMNKKSAKKSAKKETCTEKVLKKSSKQDRKKHGRKRAIKVCQKD